jgi:hypothetical protein
MKSVNMKHINGHHKALEVNPTPKPNRIAYGFVFSLLTRNYRTNITNKGVLKSDCANSFMLATTYTHFMASKKNL